MSYHTQAYVRLSEPEKDRYYQEAREIILKAYQDCMSSTPEEKVSQLFQKMAGKRVGFTREFAAKYFQDEGKKIIKAYENLQDRSKTLRAAGEINTEFKVSWKNNDWYLEIGWDTPFRSFQNTDEVFIEKSKLLEFLEKNSRVIGYYTESGDFIYGFTEELQRRIDSWYEEYGSDNCLFEVG